MEERVKVVITDSDMTGVDIERDVLEAAGFEVTFARCQEPEKVILSSKGAAALLVQYARITDEVLRQLPELRIVSCYGVGVDNVDLDAARSRGVWVANVRDYCVEEVATHSMAMILGLIRHLPFYDRAVKAGQWDYFSAGPLHRTQQLTLGIVGCGQVGRTLAKLGGGWFGDLLGYDPYLSEQDWPEGIERLANLEELFSRSNVITLHLPLTQQNQGIVDWKLLDLLQEGSYMVNAARGGLVEPEGLLRALEVGKIAGVGLDVLIQEPPEIDDPLTNHPRSLVSPHAAWYSAEAEEELRRKAAMNVVSWSNEGRPLYAVVEGGN